MLVSRKSGFQLQATCTGSNNQEKSEKRVIWLGVIEEEFDWRIMGLEDGYQWSVNGKSHWFFIPWFEWQAAEGGDATESLCPSRLTHTHTYTKRHTLILQPQVSSTHLLQQPAILYLSTSPVCNNTLRLALRNSIMISLGTVNHSLTPSFTQTQTIMWYYRLHFALCLPDTVSLCELGTPGPVLIRTHPTSSEGSASKRLFNFGHRFH